MNDFSTDFTSRVDLQKIIKEKGLNVLYTPEDPTEIMVSSSDVNRPGLAFAGFFVHFDPKRIQIIGNAETSYLNSLDAETKRERLTDFFTKNPVAVVITDGNTPDEILCELAEYFEIPLNDAHRAWCDAEATALLYLKLQEL